MLCLVYAAWTQWMLGYPDTALARSQEALTLAHQQAHPFSLAYALVFARLSPSIPPRRAGRPGAG